MKPTTLEKIANLQKHPANVRNICILAHVDHGKTTLADTLVASNGIISQRMAGKLRYLDSREDEQLRGITMKSSAISLHYAKGRQEYLVNLIDSPGHIDFSSEVSTAVRLCDGAVVLVDVVEGVCPQTHAVLRQAWLENIRPVLVLNKLDRLITELKMAPLEAYIHLQHILEQVNAITGELFTTEVLEKTAAVNTESDSKKTCSSPTTGDQVYDWSSGLEEVDDSNLYFSPDQGNVLFASAIDGWGFGISHFAEMFTAKLGLNADSLRRTLWGDFYLEVKTKRIKKGAQAKGKKPLFVQFILENLWSVYDAVLVRKDKEKTEKIIKSLNLKILAREARHSDARVHLHAICNQWLPLSTAVLDVVVDQLPSPLDISAERVEKLLCSRSRRFDSLPAQTQQLKTDFLTCSSADDAPVVVFVSKMFVVDKKVLPQNRQRTLTQEEIADRRALARKRHNDKLAAASAALTSDQSETDKSKASDTAAGATAQNAECGVQELVEVDKADTEDDRDQVFVAFARVFSGTVRRGHKLYVLGPKHDPVKLLREMGSGADCDPCLTSQYVTSFKVDDLYLFMGRELECMEEIPAGNVLGIGGLEEHILKSATISSTVACSTFTDMFFEAAPIVRVAVEPVNAGDMAALMRGMKLLNQADPCVQILVQETGEHVVIAAGEVHLQKCIDDLRERFAKVEVNVSAPIVPFRETVVPTPKVDMVNEAIEDQNLAFKSRGTEDTDSDDDEEEEEKELGNGLIQIRTPNKRCTFRIRAVALPGEVTQLLEEHADLIKTLVRHLAARMSDRSETKLTLNEETIVSLKQLKSSLEDAFTNAGAEWTGAVDQIWAFGPRGNGPNVLLNRMLEYGRQSVWSCLDRTVKNGTRDYDSSVVSGFQLATLAGPLCEEPMMGVCFVIEDWSIVNSEACSNGDHVSNGCDTAKRDPTSYGAFSGQIMSTVKAGCRRAFTSRPQRLMAAMYTCVIQADVDVLGKMYAVLGKRNGRVLSEEMREGSSIFSVTAALPVVESFGFAEEFRKRTSGLASPQLKFSHWEVIDVDPFWEPTTEEEYLHFGEKADSANPGKVYMNSVRRRKGLKVSEKLVQFAEKQRTLNKKK